MIGRTRQAGWAGRTAQARPASDETAVATATATADVTSASVTGTGAPSLWHNRDFLTFWAGESASLLGSQVTILALPLTAVATLHASDEQVGLLRFVQLAPYVALAVVFGVWVDRSRRRTVMLWSNLARMVLIALIPLLNSLHALGMPALVSISGAIGVASVLFDLCWMSYLPILVRHPTHYVEASSKIGISTSTAEVAGPGMAGLLVGWLTAPVALVVDAGSYLASLLSLLLVRTREPRPQPPGTTRSVLADLRDGLRWVFQDRTLRWLAGIGFCCNFSMNTVWTMFLLYATHDLHLDSRTLGAIFGIASIGGLVGAVVSRPMIARYRLGRVYLVAQSGLLLGPLLILLAAGPRPLMIGMFVLSFFTTYLGLGVAGVIIVSLRQTTTPQSMMGRMTGCFRTLLFGGGAFGGLCAGLLAGAFGPRQGLVLVASASALVVIGLLASPVSRLHGLPAPVLDSAAPTEV